MSKVRLTDEQKREFIDAYLKYREDGKTTQKRAYKCTCACLIARGKAVPTWWAFRKWLEKGLKADQTDDAEEVPEVSEGAVSDGSGGSDEGREDQEDAPAEEETSEDYTSRLELMVRLYRRRSERDVDAVCDRLLPELLAEE